MSLITSCIEKGTTFEAVSEPGFRASCLHIDLHAFDKQNRAVPKAGDDDIYAFNIYYNKTSIFYVLSMISNRSE